LTVAGEKYIVRPGKREDAAQAARLWMQSAEEHTAYDRVYTTAPGAEKTMRRFLIDLATSSHAFLLVAVTQDREERVIGFISGELREGSPAFSPKTWVSVDDIFVTPEYRSLGVGKALFESARSWAKERGASGISLQVAVANERGRRFYQNLGFREVSVYEVLEF
jgi:GNAT superfamily N-acetyltransferase